MYIYIYIYIERERYRTVLPRRDVAHGRRVDDDLEAPHARLGDEARRPVLQTEAHPVHVARCYQHVVLITSVSIVSSIINIHMYE